MLIEYNAWTSGVFDILKRFMKIAVRVVFTLKENLWIIFGIDSSLVIQIATT